MGSAGFVFDVSDLRDADDERTEVAMDFAAEAAFASANTSIGPAWAALSRRCRSTTRSSSSITHRSRPTAALATPPPPIVEPIPLAAPAPAHRPAVAGTPTSRMEVGF